MSIGVSYPRLGEQTGRMVAEILEGTPVSEIPVETQEKYQTMINKTTAEVIGAPTDVEGAIVVE